MMGWTRRPKTGHGSLKKKMFSYTFIIIFFMTVLSIYSLSIMNVYRNRIDGMFERNLTLDQIAQDIEMTDAELVGYLSTKSSVSLNEYTRYGDLLRQDGINLEKGIGSYSEEDLLILDIVNMIDRYLEIADEAVQDKRRSNVMAYTEGYGQASTVKSYILSYIRELNIRQLGSNADSYIYMTKQVSTANALNLVLILVLIAFSIVIVLNMSDAFIEPIIRLSHSAEDMAKGKFDTKDIIVDTNDEVEILALAFGKMKESVRDYIDTLREKAFTEALLKDQEMENLKMKALLDSARLYALQSQMKPHFLFNTINAGVQMAMIEGADRTSQFLETMSRLFRYNIQNLESVVTLRQELDNVLDYHELLKVRFGSLITFDFDVDEAVLDGYIPPLTLQPIVENAYIHGLSKKEDGGNIHISIQMDQGVLNIDIADNGIGMDKDTLAGIFSEVKSGKTLKRNSGSNGVGMANVIQRMALFYKSKDLVTIDSDLDRGTAVHLKLPYLRGEKDV